MSLSLHTHFIPEGVYATQYCVFLGVLLGLGVALAQRKDPHAQTGEAPPAPIPAADSEKKNPVKSTPEGLAETKRLYHCAMCHGDEGNGKGDLAVQMKLELKDWRDPDSPAKMRLFYIITNARGKMTNRTQETRRWELVKLGAFLLA